MAKLTPKEKLIASIVLIILISLLTPALVSSFLSIGDGEMLTTGYHIDYIVYVISIHIGLFYFAVLSFLLYFLKNKT